MMQPVYINHIASIHADTASGESPYLSANEPDYKSIITNAALRTRMPGRYREVPEYNH